MNIFKTGDRVRLNVRKYLYSNLTASKSCDGRLIRIPEGTAAVVSEYDIRADRVLIVVLQADWPGRQAPAYGWVGNENLEHENLFSGATE